MCTLSLPIFISTMLYLYRAPLGMVGAMSFSGGRGPTAAGSWLTWKQPQLLLEEEASACSTHIVHQYTRHIVCRGMLLSEHRLACVAIQWSNPMAHGADTGHFSFITGSPLSHRSPRCHFLTHTRAITNSHDRDQPRRGPTPETAWSSPPGLAWRRRRC